MADGFRSGKKVNGVSTGYVYDGMYIVGESVDGVNYTYSRGTDLLGYTSSLGETVYYRTNVHGDVKELVNVFGESLERYDYNAYGAEDEDYNPFRRMFGKKSVYNPFRYTGEYTDSETGLVYLRNRMYDPETGRFISEDTHWNVENCIYGDSETGNRPTTPDIGAIIQSNNLYVYCMDNPIMYVDREGELAYPGQIHNLVVKHISDKYHYASEQTILYKNGWGRADLISGDGRVWDVKRDKDAQIAAGKAQVKKYTDNTWKANPGMGLRVGGYINPDSFVTKLNIDTYYVTYRYAGDGVIAYDYYKVTDWDGVKEFVKNAIGIIVIAGGVYAVVQSGGTLAPALVPIIAETAITGG